MKRILVLVICILVGNMTYAQSKKERKQNKIKSATEWETRNVNGKTNTYKVSYEEYDRSGKITQHTDYSNDGKILYRTSVLFDKNDNKIEETELDVAKNKNWRKTFKYNALNDKTEEVEYNGSGMIVVKTQFNYDPNGNKISETVTDANGRIVKKSIFTYNSKNLKTGKQTTGKGAEEASSKKWDYVYY
ncbi:MAG: hypothetical protein M0P58_03120 [Bacteroidales bacterium]|jgi:hypothetical protein|nr:hypothetical protein [Bacteroidales bacterium]